MIGRIFDFFDPAREGFFGRMLRLLAGLAVIPILGLCILSFLAMRSEGGRYVLARAFLDNNLPRFAFVLASDLAEDFPEEWEYHRIEGWSLRRSGEYERSLQSYERAIEIMPDNWWPHSHLCFYSALLSDPQPVMDHCDRAVELAPEGEHSALYRRGIARLRIDDLEGASQDLALALEIWPEDENEPQHHDAITYLAAAQDGRNVFDEEAMARELARY